MTLTSLYNIIDSIFIGHGMGALAISGLAITFPLMNLLVAFCTLVGVGGPHFLPSDWDRRIKRGQKTFSAT
jgi:Na+-driven multidrug efflux pump